MNNYLYRIYRTMYPIYIIYKTYICYSQKNLLGLNMNKNILKKATIVLFIGILTLSVALAGCTGGQNGNNDDNQGNGDQNGNGSVTQISIQGSSTVLPIAAAAAEKFNQNQDNIQVSVSGGGSSVGIKSVATGQADIGDASREVKQSEIDEYGDKFVDHEIAFDGIAVIVSKNIYDQGVKELTLDEVKQIFTGQIENWNQVGGPDAEIFVNEREEGSGTREVFIGTVELSDTDADAAHGGNSGVRQAVGKSENAIGYVGLGYVGGSVRAVNLNGVEPSEANVKSGDYPIYRSLHMYTWGEPSDAEKAFLDFVMSEEGQEIVADQGFIKAQD